MIGRRAFVRGATVAGVLGGLGVTMGRAGAAEAPPETTRLRIPRVPSACRSPEWIAEELLRAEGFTDVQYVPTEGTRGVEQTLASGETDIGGHFAAPVIDAFLCFPPVSQELRARKIGHVLVNSSVDRPWAQYFCCITVGNREFVRKQPVATKRAVRALLKATDLCAREPERVARLITDRGYVDRYDYALQTMREIPYDRWRQQDPADTIRFYALRLREAGMIKATPQKILAQGSEWRFLEELKQELKG